MQTWEAIASRRNVRAFADRPIAAADATPDQILAAVEARIGELIRAALGHPGGPLAGACEQAGGFLRSWWGEPPGPPFAPAE